MKSSPLCKSAINQKNIATYKTVTLLSARNCARSHTNRSSAVHSTTYKHYIRTYLCDKVTLSVALRGNTIHKSVLHLNLILSHEDKNEAERRKRFDVIILIAVVIIEKTSTSHNGAVNNLRK